MKAVFAKLGAIVLIVGLTVCSSRVLGADWKEFAEATTGVFRYDAASISSPSEGLVRVWINNLTKNETDLVELKCKDNDYRVLSFVQWDEAFHVRGRQDYPDADWVKISPRSVPEALCKTLFP